MKKIITLSLSLLIVAGLNAADNTENKRMSNEEAVKKIEMAGWNIENYQDKKSFEKVDQALNALTPETCRENIDRKEFMTVLNKRLSIFYPEYKTKP